MNAVVEQKHCISDQSPFTFSPETLPQKKNANVVKGVPKALPNNPKSEKQCHNFGVHSLMEGTKRSKSER